MLIFVTSESHWDYSVNLLISVSSEKSNQIFLGDLKFEND